jgi:peptidoglycan/LPS O-acetylase OafA/YrhL
MPAALQLKPRLEALIRRIPIPAIRDVVSKQPSTGRNLDALDGIRGLAVLLVIAAHTDGFRMKGHGAVGVWLFFALSAFLLTLPYAADPGRIANLRELRRYFARRVRRILPAYYFAIVVMALLTDAGSRFLWQHFSFQRAAGIFWTIPQELLFYLLLPPLAALHPFVFQRRFAATIAGLAAIALCANIWLTGEVIALHGNGKRLAFHLGIFVTGMAFAYASQAPTLARAVARPWLNRTLDVTGLLILLFLVFSAPYYFERAVAAVPALGLLGDHLGLRNKNAFGVLSGALIYVVYVCERGWTRRILASVPLRALGVVSFSLYLFHVMVESRLGFRMLGLEHGNELFAVTLGVTYLVACCIYSLIERPFMQMRPRQGST